MKASLSVLALLGTLAIAQSANAQPHQLQMAPGQYATVNLDPALENDLDDHLDDILTQYPGDPAQTTKGAVVMVARHGKVVYLKQSGDRDLHPAHGPIPMTTDTIFDLESMTKPFTATVILKMHELGLLDIADAASNYLPEIEYIVDSKDPYSLASGAPKDQITIRHLLTFTSGLDIDVVTPLYDRTDNSLNGSDNYLQMSHEPALGAPGASVLYSDLAYRLLGQLAERAYADAYPASPKTLRQLVKLYVTDPLGMADTDYEPVAFMPSKLGRVAALGEFAHYGLVPNVPGGHRHGEVQDDQDWWVQRHNTLFPNAMDPGNVGPTGTGCDGLFSTAWDLGQYAQMLLNNGQHYTCTSSGCSFQQVLTPWSVGKLTTIQTLDASNQPIGDPAPTGWTWDLLLANKAAGFELAQYRNYSVGGHWISGYSKTGGAGTFLIVDPWDGLFIVVLTNHGLPDFGNFVTEFDNMLEEIGPHRIADSVAGAILDPVLW